MAPRRPVAFKEDLERLDAALRETQRATTENAAAIRKVGSDVSRGFARVDRALSKITQNVDEFARFFEVGPEALPDLRQRMEALEGFVGGMKRAGENMRTFGVYGGTAATVADALIGTFIGGQAEALRREAAERRHSRNDATFQILRQAQLDRRRVEQERAAFDRAQRGLR